MFKFFSEQKKKIVDCDYNCDSQFHSAQFVHSRRGHGVCFTRKPEIKDVYLVIIARELALTLGTYKAINLQITPNGNHAARRRKQKKHTKRIKLATRDYPPL